MLLQSGTLHGDQTTEITEIQNYYERMVYDEIIEIAEGSEPADFLADVACVALNHLPPRYIRHEVDMAFYMSPNERAEIQQKITNAVKDALVFVREKGKERSGA